MNRSLLLAVFCAALATPALAQRPDPIPPHRADYPGGIAATFDVVYKTVPGYRPLTLDVYGPAQPGGPSRPLVVYVHGGNWVGGSARSVGSFPDGPKVFAELAARGYVVASVDYRLSAEARFPAAEQDVKSAIRWLKANAAAWGVDPARVAVWGGSAGGELAALAAATCGPTALEPPPARGQGEVQPSDCVQAAVLWYPLVDILALDQAHGGGADTVEGRYLGCALKDCAPGLAAAANPITYLSASPAPPTLIVQGTADRLVPFQQSQTLQAALQAKGGRADLMLVPDVDHLFAAGSPEANLKVGREVMERVYAFLDGTVGRKP
jgi:acetyl esterase/lipase